MTSSPGRGWRWRLAAVAAVAAAPAGADGWPSVTPAEVLVRLRPAAGRPAALDSLYQHLGLRSVEPVFAPPPAAVRLARRPAARAGLGRWLRLRFDGSTPPAQLASRLVGSADIEAVTPNYLRRFARSRSATFAPNDPLLGEQWNLAAIGWTASDPGRAAGVLVAVIDSGVDEAHPDLAASIWHNPAEVAGTTGVDDDGNGYVDDVAGWDFADAPGMPGEGDYLDGDAEPGDESGHGTHVAGVLAATVGNGIGIAGVAPGVSLLVARAGFNLGGAGYLQDDDVAAAVVYAADNGARVINLSLGDPRYSPLLAEVVRYATDQGAVVVAAAGNDGSADVFYPARLDEAVAVAASGRDGLPATFSNFGPSIDLIAPGVAIRSTQPGGGYGELSGTSMAAPHVAGMAALVLSRHPEYSPLQVRGALAAVAVDLGAPGWDEATGHGLLQVPPAGVGSPVAVSIAAPISDQRLGVTTVPVRLDLEGPGSVDYRVDWAASLAPTVWRLVGAGRWEGPAAAGPQLGWSTASLAPGRYTLRASARATADSGRGHEARVVVDVGDQAALVSRLRASRVLQGPRWRDLVEWQTDRLAPGRVELTSRGEPVLILTTPDGRVDHEVVLPEDLPVGDYGVRVMAEAQGPTAAEDSLRVEPAGIVRWHLDEGPTYPAGYLLPRPTDFDADGQPELVSMPYAEGAGSLYGATSFFVLSRPLPIYTTSRLFIPWDVGDLDGDGLQELMAVDSRRVRLLEQTAAKAFPERVVAEVRDTWGGGAADLDGDGVPEMFLRSATAPLLRVFEARGDDDYGETAVLVNPTAGENELGDRQVVGDLDGDGRGDLLVGDSDGDLFAFESPTDDVYRLVWSRIEADDAVDGRLLGGGVDVDGDGRAEFLSGRLRRDPYSVEERRWTLAVFGARGDDVYDAEWETRVAAGTTAGAGIAAADLDGDGDLEWVVVTVPHLYVFRATEGGGFEPAWHAPARGTQSPLAGDLDGDGRAELVFNSDGGVLQVVGFAPPAAGLDAPAAWEAYPEGPTAARLSWALVPGAAAYVVLRDGAIVATIAGGPVSSSTFTWVDTSLSRGLSYRYAVAATDDRGLWGHATASMAITPQPGPLVSGAARLAAKQVALTFDQPMGPSAADPFRYTLDPDVAVAEAVVLDRSQRRAVIAFDRGLPDSGSVRILTWGVRSTAGALLADGGGGTALALAPALGPTRLVAATAPTSTALSLRFDRPVTAPAGTAALRVDGGAVTVLDVAVGADGRTVDARLSPDTPLRPRGRRYEVEVRALRDDLGRPVTARAFVAVGTEQLEELVLYPNPYDPGAGTLTVAGLPRGARVGIFTLAGELVWGGAEEDDDGGLQWDGRNAGGAQVAAGVYLVRADHDGRVRRGRIAVVNR